MLFYNIQLAVAIYHYLEELTYIKGESLSRSKSKAIENKTCELVRKLDKDGQLFCNYAISPYGDEKDVLFISKDKAFIIECKSNKLRKYSRDTEKSFHIIKQQFEKSVLEGYEQATEVLNVLKSQHTVSIYEKDSDTLKWKVDTTQLKEIHIVIVTQERYSLIQNNPSLLLPMGIDVTPSCFCIDDLETILLTFIRMCNPIKEFCEYLSVKEKLSPRLIYDDELDLAGKFLLERSVIIQCLQDKHLAVYENHRCVGRPRTPFVVARQAFHLVQRNQLSAIQHPELRHSERVLDRHIKQLEYHNGNWPQLTRPAALSAPRRQHIALAATDSALLAPARMGILETGQKREEIA
jgi:hypothetical protein